ncbi:MAG: hypothetical protein ACOY71_09275 [Gemmatimonadota bacterium]
MTRWWWSAGLGLAGFLAGAAWQAEEPPPAWLTRSGVAWLAASPEARALYVEGFVAGASVAQAAAAGAADSATILARVRRLRQDGELVFPFAPSLYGSRLADHLWWENHRHQPVWWALWEVNQALRPDGGRDRR